MIRVLILSLFTVAGLSTGTVALRAFARQELKPYRLTTPTSLPNVVAVHMLPAGKCTGFLVAKDTVVTAAHCFEGSPPHVKIEFENHDIVDGLLIEKGKWMPIDDSQDGDDVAIIRIAKTLITPLSLAKPKYPLKCLSVGYGGIFPDQKSVPCDSNGMESTHLILYHGDIDYGDSGGPVIDMDGNVVGIQVQLMTSGNLIFFVVPSETIQMHLDSSKK